MKKRILLPTLGLLSIGAIVPMATLTQTSCFSESLVAAPDEFYYHGGADYIGFGGKVFSGVSSARVIFDTQGDETKAKTEAFKLLQDRSKYTVNMIKWDIIHTWVFSYGKGSGGNETDFSAKFLDFQTTPTKIQYKLEVTPKDEKPVIYYTSMDGTMGGEYGGYAFNKDDIGSIGAYSETGLSWSYYTIPLSQAATGLAINSLVSVFMYYK